MKISKVAALVVLVFALKEKISAAEPPPDPPTFLRDVRPIFLGKCARCHTEASRVLPNWLDYATAFKDRVEIKRRVWQSWRGAYFKQPMPAGNSWEARSMTEDERLTVKRWVDAGAPRGVPETPTTPFSKSERIEKGRKLFGIVCAVCHQAGGQGVAGKFPPLAASDFLNADKQRAIRIVLHGLQGEITVNGRKFNNAMPKFPLDDQDIASVLTYVYNSFGNTGSEITPPEVAAARRVDTSFNGRTHNEKAVQEKSPFE